MKRRFFRASWMFALAGLTAFSLVGTSCGSDDDDDDPIVKPTDTDPTKGGNDDPDKPSSGDTPSDKPAAGPRYIVVETTDRDGEDGAQDWDNQFWVNFPDYTAAEGDEWIWSMEVKADQEAEIGTQMHKQPSEYLSNGGFGAIKFTTDWVKLEGTYTCAAGDEGGQSVAFNLSQFRPANKYYFRNVSVKAAGKEVVVNGDMSGDDASSFVTKIFGGDLTPSEFKSEEGGSPSAATAGFIVVETTDRDGEDGAQDWDNQFWVNFPDYTAAEGDEWIWSMEVKADQEAEIGTQMHKEPGTYLSNGGFSTIKFTTDWVKLEGTYTCAAADEGGQSVAFNLSQFRPANKYYFRNVSVKAAGKEVIKNGDMSGDDASSFFSKSFTDGNIVNSTISK